MLLSLLKRAHFGMAIAVAALAASLWLFLHPLLPVAVSPDEPLIPVRNADKKWGYINSRGRMVIPFQWDMTDGFDANGMAAATNYDRDGWIDRKGKVVIPLQWQIREKNSYARVPVLQEFDSRGWIAVSKNGGGSGWIDRKGREILPRIWSGTKNFKKDNLAMVRKDNHWGWVNREGRTVVPVEWDDAAEFDTGDTARVQKHKKWGWINREGKLVLPLAWDEAEDFDSDGLARVARNGKWGWIDRQGKVLPLQWDAVEPFDAAGMAKVEKDKKYGWISRKGEIVLPVEWETAGAFDEQGMAMVRDASYQWGWINRKGEVVIACQFNKTAPFDRSNHAWVLKRGQLGQINRKGDWAKRLGGMFQELSVNESKDGELACVMVALRKSGCLDRKGKWIIPLDNWLGIQFDDAIAQEEKMERFQYISAYKAETSFLSRGLQWLTDKLLSLKAPKPKTNEFALQVVYDRLNERIIWTNHDRKREIWWAAWLAMLAVMALFFGWKAKHRRCKPPLLLHTSSNVPS